MFGNLYLSRQFYIILLQILVANHRVNLWKMSASNMPGTNHCSTMFNICILDKSESLYSREEFLDILSTLCEWSCCISCILGLWCQEYWVIIILVMILIFSKTRLVQKRCTNCTNRQYKWTNCPNHSYYEWFSCPRTYQYHCEPRNEEQKIPTKEHKKDDHVCQKPYDKLEEIEYDSANTTVWSWFNCVQHLCTCLDSLILLIKVWIGGLWLCFGFCVSAQNIYIMALSSALSSSLGPTIYVSDCTLLLMLKKFERIWLRWLGITDWNITWNFIVFLPFVAFKLTLHSHLLQHHVASTMDRLWSKAPKRPIPRP